MFWSLVHKEHSYLLMYSSAWKLLFYMLPNMKSTQQTAGSVLIWKEVVRPSFVMTAIEHFQYGNISQQVFDLDVKDNLNFTAKDKVRRATITLSHEFLIYWRYDWLRCESSILYWVNQSFLPYRSTDLTRMFQPCYHDFFDYLVQYLHSKPAAIWLTNQQ